MLQLTSIFHSYCKFVKHQLSLAWYKTNNHVLVREHSFRHVSLSFKNASACASADAISPPQVSYIFIESCGGGDDEGPFHPC